MHGKKNDDEHSYGLMFNFMDERASKRILALFLYYQVLNM